jgi:uncharacterized protein YndB with AHSA1/START domain
MQQISDSTSGNVAIIHRVGIRASLQKVYEAVSTINGVSGWWTEQTSGTSGVGEEIVFQFLSPEGEELGKIGMEVIALEPEVRVQWKCKSGPSEWIDTNITFDLHREGDYTIVLFGHRNWAEAVEFTAHCSMKWGIFMLSLKEFVETGKGRPSPNDIKIDNWN